MSDDMLSPRMRAILAIVVGAINSGAADVHAAVQATLADPVPREEIDALLRVLYMVGFREGEAYKPVEARIESTLRGDPNPDSEPPW